MLNLTEWEDVFALSYGLILVGIIINCAEFLWARDQYRPGGILAWAVLRTKSAVTFAGPSGRVFSYLYGYRGVVALTGVQLAFAIIAFLYVILYRDVSIFVQGVVVVTLLFLHYRTYLGLDGADQMTAIVVLSLLLGSAFDDERVRNAALFFVAAQSALSYLVAGGFKLTAKGWRDGTFLFGVLNTEGHGTKSVAVLLRAFPGLSLLLSWTLLVFECTFPLALFLGPTVALVYIAAGTFFHIMTAAFMGLNNFVWAFVAAYPAVYYCSSFLAS